MLASETPWLVAAAATFLHALGALSAVHAVMVTRTSQGAIAWAISLITFPYAALPFYWVFGRGKFYGYIKARRAQTVRLEQSGEHRRASGIRAKMPEGREGLIALESLSEAPFTSGNRTKLLVDGAETFGEMFQAIDSAERYIAVEFFIIHDDRIGRDFKARLIASAKRGVKIYLLYDLVGSHDLPDAYVADLREAGIQAHEFRTTKAVTRFQVNFRNHRKIVIVDGKTAFVGGLNVGDEYLGRDPSIGPWRDTHVRVDGPAVQGVQIAFVEDWHWATGKVPPLSWELAPTESEGKTVLSLATGPSDPFDSCSLFYAEMIRSARRRLWIATPYFVPDRENVGALQLAALRGVDVRILIPEHRDHMTTWLAAFTYVEKVQSAGAKVFFYRPGFMHQKIALVDDDLASVGTANFDNRSFRLNFEITWVVVDKGFAGEIEAMLTKDLERCRPADDNELANRPFWFRLAVRVANLFSPIL